MAVAAAVGAIIAGLSAAGAAYAASLTMGWIIAAGVAAAAASYLASSMMMKVGDLGNTQYSSTSSQSSRSTSPSTGIPIVYGGEHDALIKTGSIIAWQNVQNDQSNYLCTVHCISIGEVDNFINQLYFDNVAVLGTPITQEGIVSSGYIKERFRPYLQLEVRFGSNQYDDSMSLAKQYGGSRWSDEMRGDGLVTITSVIRKTQDSQIDGILVNYNYALAVEMRGRKINDVLTNTIKTSSNPVSILTDYITNNYFGLGIDPVDIDTDSFRIAAQYCENNQLRCNGTISYDKTFKRNIESILQTFGGVLYQSGSKFKIAMDVADLSVASFSEDNIIGSVQLNSGSQNDYYNCIDASYTNPKNDYANDVIRFPSDIMESGILVKDGTIKKKDEDYLLVQDKGQLAFLVNPEILKSKYVNSTIQFNTYDALNVSVWDVITVTYDELGYVDKKFRVASKTLPFSAEQIGLCQLSCVEYYDEIYEGTDTGIFPQDGFKTNLPDASTVIAPANIQVVKKGTSSNGNIVTITWDHSTDHNLAGYYVKYRESTSSSWIEIGSVNKYTSSFEISLPTNRAYQFSVQAYNNLGYVSVLISTSNIIPEYSFSLPSITGLRLLNSTTSTLITDAQDFRFQWDDQSHLVVNGKKFSDYFRYYEVRLYNGSTYIRSFNVTSTSFDLTHDLNTVGRKPTIGIIAHGFNTGTYSAEVKVTVENKQHAIPSNVSVKGGFGSLYVSWAKSTEKDYAGTQIVIVDSTNRSTVTNTIESEFTSINLDDGTYKIRVGHYDVFGTDNIIFSTEQTVTIKSDYQFSQEDVDNIKGLLNLTDEVNGAIEQSKNYTDLQIADAKIQIQDAIEYTDQQMQEAIDLANSNTATVVQQSKNEITNETNTKITASETKLTTQFTNGYVALNQRINLIQSSTANNSSRITDLTKTVTDNNTATTTRINTIESSVESANSNVTNLTKTVSDNKTATSQQISSLDSKFTGQVNTTNSNVTNLSNAISTQNSSNASQFSNITSTLSNVGSNILSNSSFELGTATNSDGWNVYNNASVSATVSKPAGRIDGVAMQVTFNAASTSTHGVYTGINIPRWQAAQWYTVSFYAKKINGAGFSGCNLAWNSPQPSTTQTVLNPTLSTQWQRYAFNIFWNGVISTRQELYITRTGSSVAGDAIIIDDVMVTAGQGLVGYSPTNDDGARAQISTLNSTVVNNQSSTAQSITALDSKFTGQINTTNSNVTNLNKTVADNNTSTAQNITNLDTKFTGQISTTNSNVTNLINAVSNQNSANASQFNNINSTLNSDLANLFYNPNALTTLNSGFSSGGITIPVSSTAPTSNVYRITGRDNVGTKSLQVSAGDVYNLSMYCQTDSSTSPNITIGLWCRNKAGNNLWVGATSRAANNTWAKIEGTVTIPSGYISASVWIQLNYSSNTEYWNVTGIQCNNANIYNKVNAQITQLNSTMVTADQANATAINQVQTNLSNNTATVNTKIDTSINTLTNNINSTYSLTAQANGVVSGIKLVANSGASTNSAIYFVADKFVVSPSASTANSKSPFTIDSGIVYLNNAMIKNASIGNALIADASITNAKIVNGSINNLKIQDGSITNAKISGDIQSDNWVNGSGWRLGKSGANAGQLELKSAASGQRVELDTNGLRVYDNTGQLRVAVGVI